MKYLEANVSKHDISNVNVCCIPIEAISGETTS